MVLIEQLIYEYLNECKDAGEISVPAFLMRPENEPTEYLLIEKTGSAESNRITSATIAIQSYGSTLYRASTINSELKACMRDLVSNNAISRCVCATDYNFTNTATKHPRYQAVYEITYYDE